MVRKARFEPRRIRPGAYDLSAPGWNIRTRKALEQLIRKGAGKGLPVVFDFDNTLQHGDIGEATLAVLVQSGRLDPSALPTKLAPSFHSPRHGRLDLKSGASIVEYYQALLAPTVHGESDRFPLGTGYSWAVEVMGGLGLSEVIDATEQVCSLAHKGERTITVAPGKEAFPIPCFYPEMVELLSRLLQYEFDVWIISASNVWSVRWRVLRELNPLLVNSGRQIAADHVIGTASLLADAQDRLYKDAVLVRENAAYASMQAQALAQFKLTSHLQLPVPAYSGKVACIFDAIGRTPYLGAGDGPGDHAMLAVSLNRLWIAYPHRGTAMQTTGQFIQHAGSTGWLVQAATSAPVPRFLDSPLDADWLLSGGPQTPLPTNSHPPKQAIPKRERLLLNHNRSSKLEPTSASGKRFSRLPTADCTKKPAYAD